MAADLTAFRLIAGGSLATVLLLTGCQSAPADNAAATPNVGPRMTDVRTEAAIIQMENQYIAEKNSQPTRQHEAEAKAAKKKQEREAREKKAAQERNAAEAEK